MITVVTVNWNAYDFTGLLAQSLDRFTEVPYALVVVDNSDARQRLEGPRLHQFFMPNNVGHGHGLNWGVRKAAELYPDHPFLMFLDCDCHVLRNRWEVPFLNHMKHFDLLGGKGPPSKPIRPACLFMRKKLGGHDWCGDAGFNGNRATPGGYDVAIKAYYKIMADNYRIGFLASAANRYGTANGEEWCLDGVPLVYHHWHGSHLAARQPDYPAVDLEADRRHLFSQIPWRLP